MLKSYRLPINVNGDDQNISFNIEQDFDTLDVLTLKIKSSDVYNRPCSDYGVIVGRVNLNDGFGVQNAKVSVFIPISSEDLNRPEIKQIYPFETPSDTFPNGLRYNLLPRVRNNKNPSHRAVGSFPDISDFSHYPQYVEVLDKYYKYTTITNESGDYMIFGVPLGTQNIIMDFDIFDSNSINITANDLAEQLYPEQFSSDNITIPDFIHVGDGNYEVEIKNNIDNMPNIFHQVKQINVSPFWGDESLCDVGITRCDFNIDFKYTPTAIFFGFIHSPSGGYAIRDDYSITLTDGLEIMAKDEELGYLTGNILPMQDMEVVVYRLNDSLTIGSRERVGVFKGSLYNGVFTLSLPMYFDYYITNEFGDLIKSNNNTGIPTKGYYAFEIYDMSEKWSARRLAWGGFKNPVIPGIRIPSNNSGDINLGGWQSTWGGLFEYDINNRRRKFYTIKTTHRSHKENNLLLDGDNIDYFPTFNPNKAKAFWNFPIHREHVSEIKNPTIIGSALIPRMEIKLEPSAITGLISGFIYDLKHPSGLVDLPNIPLQDSFNVRVEMFEYYLGLGVQANNGLNSGIIFQNIYRPNDYIINGNNIYGTQDTWNFGDNSSQVFIPTLYSLQFINNELSNANEYGVHKAYNQVVFNDKTFGCFVNCVDVPNLNKRWLMEINIHDVTDDLSDLINDSVYSSYNKNTDLIPVIFDDNEIDISEIYVESPASTEQTITNESLILNTYKGNFYYFGMFDNANALKHIENFYFIDG